MHHREDHINTLTNHTIVLEAQQALTTDGRNGTAVVLGIVHPGTGRQFGIVLTAEDDPIAILGNTHGNDIVLAVINIIQNGLGRAKGNLMLGADAAEQNTNAEFLHN